MVVVISLEEHHYSFLLLCYLLQTFPALFSLFLAY